MRSRTLVIVAGLIELALMLGACGAGVAERAAAKAVDTASAAAAPTAPLVTPLPQPKDVADADAQVKHWHDEADQARQEATADRSRAEAADARAAAADAQAKLAEKRAERLRIALWQSRLLWSAGVMLLGVLAGVALEFILPAQLRGWATLGIAISIALAVVCLALRIVLPWLMVVAQVVAWLLAIAVVGALLWLLAKAIRAVLHAAQHGDRMEGLVRSLTDWIDPDVLEHLISTAKAESAALQASTGVRTLIDAVRGKPKGRPLPAVKPMPDALPASPAAAAAARAPTEDLKAVPPAEPGKQG
jgi:hypothetical protein